MNIRFKLNSFTCTASTRDALMDLITGYGTYFRPNQGVAGVLIKPTGDALANMPMQRPEITPNTVDWTVRVYSLQKFNTKFENTVDEKLSTPSKKIVTSRLIRSSHWEAKVYNINAGVLAYLGLRLTQQARHFVVHKM